MTNIEIDISHHDPATRWPQELEELIHTAIKTTLARAPFSIDDAELSVVLGDDEFIQELNKNYRDKDKPTNVLSFPQMEPAEFESAAGHLMLGDIILAHETIEREAIEQDKGFESHLMHLLVHGTLHLLGYDHIEDGEAEEMEKMEIETLKALGIKNPYEFAPVVA